MSKIHLTALALLMMAALGAASEDVTPYLEITSPADGSTVFGMTTINIEAEGKNLEKPYLSIKGDFVGQDIPLNCAVSTLNPDGNQKMVCSYKWNSSAFKDQKVSLNATVNSSTGKLQDSARVYVSGKRA